MKDDICTSTSVLSALASIADKYSDSEDDSHKLFTDWDKEPNQSLTLGVCRDARALLASSAFAAAPDAMREALKDALGEIVLVIAFLERDGGTDRLPATIKSLVARLVKADRAIRDTLSAPVPPADGAAEAKRYRRLQVIGCAPDGTDHLKNGTVLRFSNLDAFLDADMRAYPSRGDVPSGTGAAEPVAWQRYIPDIVKNAMLTMWNHICGDTAHHPLDIEHGKGKYLTFTPRHWAEMTGNMVAQNIADLYAVPTVKGDRESQIEVAAKYLDDLEAGTLSGNADTPSQVAEKLRVQPGAGEREHHKLDNERQVFFYEQDFYVLSNFSAFTLLWRGIRFQTSEQAYHWEKFLSEQPGLKFHRDTIHSATSTHEAFKYAEQNKQHRRPDWDSVKIGIMRDILRAKAEQHEYVRRKLLATGDRELIEDSWRDDFWGWGPNRNGRNVLGKIWMEIRDELRSRQAPHSGDGEVHDQ